MTTPDANGWLPIESAPKDGLEILFAEGGEIYLGYWNGCAWIDGRQTFFGDHYEYHPTHWQPLPNPPVSEPSL